MWFRKWLFIFDSFLILSQTTHLSFTTTIYPLQWRIQGRDPEVRPPLTFWPNWGKIFLETGPPPPPHLRVWMIHLRPYLKIWIRHCSKSNLLYTIYTIVKLFWMEGPISFSTKFEYLPVPEGRVIHQTILHLLVWGFLFYPAKKSRNRQCLPS